MKSLEEIFSQDDISKIVADLKKKQVVVPAWSDLVNQYEPRLHDIMTNKEKYPDKAIKDEKGDIIKWEKVTRVCIGLQKLSVKRVSEFMFNLLIHIRKKYDKKRKRTGNRSKIAYRATSETEH